MFHHVRFQIVCKWMRKWREHKLIEEMERQNILKYSKKKLNDKMKRESGVRNN